MKAHFLGHNPADGANVFEDCETGELVGAHPMKSGKPILPGQQLATITRHADGEHYSVDEIDTGAGTGRSGPPQVATESYRSGWEATFGKRRGPAN
jgi:hypothetical protein